MLDGENIALPYKILEVSHQAVHADHLSQKENHSNGKYRILSGLIDPWFTVQRMSRIP